MKCALCECEVAESVAEGWLWLCDDKMKPVGPVICSWCVAHLMPAEQLAE